MTISCDGLRQPQSAAADVLPRKGQRMKIGDRKRDKQQRQAPAALQAAQLAMGKGGLKAGRGQGGGPAGAGGGVEGGGGGGRGRPGGGWRGRPAPAHPRRA